jgi:hypothetical protein
MPGTESAPSSARLDWLRVLPPPGRAELLEDRDRIGLLADACMRRVVEQAALEQVEQVSPRSGE